MYNCRLMFWSIASPSLNASDLDAIRRQSHFNNGRDGIRSLVLYSPPYFLALAEGPRPALSHMLHRIAQDPRHTSPELVSFSEIETACDMLDVITLQQINERAVGAHRSVDFAPNEWDADQCLRFARQYLGRRSA